MSERPPLHAGQSSAGLPAPPGTLPAPTRRWCIFHDWWSFASIIRRWMPTPDWYVGANAPTSKTCIRCGKTKATNYVTRPFL